jgi:antitoxin component YwqK of YwqJK toxin-antitoxin module
MEILPRHYFDPNNKAAQHLLEYAPEPVIVQILLNIPPEDLEAFCSINNRVRRICKSGLVKEQYYEKWPIFKPRTLVEAKAFLKKNPKGLLSVKSNNFKNKDLLEIADKIVYLETDGYPLNTKYLSQLKNLKTEKFYRNGNLQREANYKDGKRNGLYRVWHYNGKLEKEMNYKDGRIEGLYREWYLNGKLFEESNYKDGELDGLSRNWYENGHLKEEGNYKDGEIDGLYREWDEDGQFEEESYE